MPRSEPTSSSVCGASPSSPKRRLSTCRIRGERRTSAAESSAERSVSALAASGQAEVALLDQVEQRNAGLRVVAGDRHHEPQVRLDQLALRGLVSRVLEPGELALLGRRQERAVADLADVELEWIRGLRLGDFLLF